MSYFKNPQGFKTHTYGKSIDVDNFPKTQKYQCWDLFAFFCQKEQLSVDTYCSLTGYAGDLYKKRYEKGYNKYFEFFYPRNAKRGDWIFWNQHVAMVWDVDIEHNRVNCLGQNQGGIARVTFKEYELSSALGCMRYIPWIKEEGMTGWVKSNDKWYYFRNGEYLTGWQKLNWSKGSNWFYFEKDGVMLTGFHKLPWQGEYEWYFLDENGAMCTGMVTLTLTFDSSGRMTGGRK